ncbi:MAG: T9SS type A sorting domain-containing protein [Chitinophagaceae bacterium]|nr:T9SS type A sorting domain-containing protein [Chitinophagaceae bacterium]
MEAYMIVDGICGEEGGGGGACENPVLEINQDVDDTCMANFSQGGLAQSYKPLDSSAAGAGIKLRESSTGLNVTLSLWDGLPNAGGTMLTTGTTQTTGDVWVDVFWDEIVNVTVGDTYYIVIEGDTSLPCIAGSINNPYPDGMVFANAYGAWPNYDYTFRTYSCGEAPSGPCADKIVMDCGVTYTADLVPGAGEWVNYTGVTWSYTGSEQVFEFTAPTTGTYTFELSQGTNDADFMVMDACSNTANNLIGGYWTGLTNETITLTGGVTYYIIADLYSGASGGTTVSIKVNCPAAGGSDCEDNKVPTGGLTNGYFFTNQLAVDIITNAAGFNIYGTKVNVFVDSGTDLNFSFNFYDDASGLPGASFDSASGTVLDSDYVGSAFGYDVYTFTVKFDHAISLAGNSTYWMEVISDGVAWESTTADIFGSQLAINNGSGWAIDDEEFVYEIICQELGLSDLTAYDFAYWPNPVKDVLNITSQKAVKTVEAYNLTGQKVMATDKIVNGQIDVNALSPGVYVFKAVLEDGQVETFKIIKK